jgi:hypothetical protein
MDIDSRRKLKLEDHFDPDYVDPYDAQPPRPKLVVSAVCQTCGGLSNPIDHFMENGLRVEVSRAHYPAHLNWSVSVHRQNFPGHQAHLLFSKD